MAFTIGLSITSSDGSSRDAVFDSETVLIGSGPSVTLRLEHDGVASIHAVIKVTPESTATVIDLGSETGTTVNGIAVVRPVNLRVGDVLGVGPVTVQVSQLGGQSAVAPPTRLGSRSLGSATVEMGLPRRSARRTTDQGRSQAQRTVSQRVGHAPAAHQRMQSPQARYASGLYTRTPSARGASLPRSPKETPVPPREARRSFVHNGDLDPALLSTELDPANRPNAQQRALEITLLWGDTVIDTVEVKEARPVVVGTRGAGKADLTLDGGFPEDCLTIAVNQGNEAQVLVPADAKVGLRRGDGTVTREVPLSPTDAPFPARAYALKLHERLVYRTGTITVMAQFVRGDAQLGAAAPIDWYFPRILAICALIFAFMVAAAILTPVRTQSLADDLFKNQNRFAQMILKAPEKEKRKKLDLSGMKGGAKAKDKEGKFGKKEKPQKDALASKAGAPRVDPNKREKDRKIAMNAGLLGMLKGGDAGAVSNVFGPGGLGTGINDAMGGLRGSAMGDAGGAGGLGSRGTGKGGGGNSLGIGGLGTHGHGRGTGGYGNIDLGGRGKGTTRIVPGRTIIKGSLSKEEIGRVIRRNLARFKFCYEKQLTKNPNLSGKISIYFTIAPTGSVAKASVRETSMDSAQVEACTVKVMRSLKFPKPRGGGIVVVTYPFVFAAT